MATGLAEANLLRAYVTPLAAGPSLRRSVGRLPARVASKLDRELARRDLPRGVSPREVKTVATLAELAHVAAQRSRLPASMTQPATHLRSVLFDSRVSRLLSEADLGVICGSEAALKTITVASELGVPSLLDYPIAHYAWTERLLSEEASLHPELADTLGHTAIPGKRARLEEEIERADRILVLTSFHRQTFVKSGVDESKLILTPFGVELDRFRPPEAHEGIGFRVLFVGQLSQRKGLSYVLEGFRRSSIAGSELHLIGPRMGSSRPWRHIAGVREIGPLPYRELPSHYRAGDVFLLPSLVEGFPQTLLEAMASGLPVIVSENTAGSEIVEDGVHGFVVPIRDADAIGERLVELSENPDRRREMGRLARRRAEQLSWDSYGERIVAAVKSSSR